jgi:hypothetical protein
MYFLLLDTDHRSLLFARVKNNSSNCFLPEKCIHVFSVFAIDGIPYLGRKLGEFQSPNILNRMNHFKSHQQSNQSNQNLPFDLKRK